MSQGRLESINFFLATRVRYETAYRCYYGEYANRIISHYIRLFDIQRIFRNIIVHELG